ncbi:MAG: ribonuclease E/G [Lachnospiraceae bacterium]
MKSDGKGKLVITKKNGYILTAMCEGDKLTEVSFEPDNETSILNNIYIAKVKNIVKNIDAAFLEIADGILCYYSLTENKKHNFLNQKKNQTLTVGDELLVQISKEAIKKKAPTATSNLNLTGKYVVLTSANKNIGISNKIEKSEDRKRLKQTIQKYKDERYGVIVRTNAAQVSEEILKKELLVLSEQMEKLFEKAKYLTCFSCIYQAPAAYLMDIRDQNEQQLEKIIIEDKKIYEELKQYLMIYQPMDLKKLELYEEDSISLWTLYGLEKQIREAMSEKVWLKSGSYLIIQPTEAMVVIDVNTGKSIGKKQPKKHFFRVNMEAAAEIARQIRLRNLSGIIIVDFIDMEEEKSKEELLKELQILLKQDRIKADLVDMTRLGLVEITRKKVKKPIYEQIPSIDCLLNESSV